MAPLNSLLATVAAAAGIRTPPPSAPASIGSASDRPPAAAARPADDEHRQDGGVAEQARIAGILDSPKAKGREGLARHLAFKTRMSVAEAEATLDAAPLPPAEQPRSALDVLMEREAVRPPGADVPEARGAAGFDTTSIYAGRAAQAARGDRS